MDATLFFYDLETSGFSPREARIMQFAGQRTNLKLEPVGDPVNKYIKLTPDVLPDLGAILLTGITPQLTLEKGMSEADFLKYFYEAVATPGTVFVGYNNIRFDDEFIRFLHYRNFYDPYEWHWKDNRSRWDLLDVVRMTRALRPDGIKWPEDDTGKPTNRLELLSKINNLEHTKAHDALSDVEATIGMAKLINDNNSKLFIYLLGMRNKTKVGELVNSGDPFVYTSGKYSGEFNHTTVVEKLSDHPQHQGALVYDLRIDPLKFVDLTPEELAELWTWNEDRTIERLPVKTLQLHRCPVVAPLSVINSDNAWDRLGLNLDQVSKNRKILKEHSDFSDKLIAALRILDKQRDTSHTTTKTSSVDAQLYEGFFDNYDRQEMNIVRSETTEKLCASTPTFHDGRLSNLLPLYLARNYPNKASKEVINTWRTYVANYLLSGGATSRLKTYMTELEDKKLDKSVGDREKNLLNSLELWAKLVEKTGSVENESAT